jgi:hypothetical protein
MEITQEQANALLELAKYYRGSEKFDFPDLGGAIRIPLHSADNKEEFSLDITRGKLELKKNTFQNRARRTIILARIDIGGSTHRNPDGEEIPCPHLHLYKEGYADKWAMPIPDNFRNISDIWETLQEFMRFCNIVSCLPIERSIFV